MRLLLDVGVSPRLRQPFRQQLGGALVKCAEHHNWRSLRDHDPLSAAERGGFTAPTTTDGRMAAEQPHTPIAIIAFDDISLAGLLAAASSIAEAVRSALPGEKRLVPVARFRR